MTNCEYNGSASTASSPASIAPLGKDSLIAGGVQRAIHRELDAGDGVIDAHEVAWRWLRALRLPSQAKAHSVAGARCFGSDAQGWLNLQTTDDLKTAEKANAKAIAEQVAPREPVTA